MPTSTTCPGCGNLVPLGDRFCGSCGTPITGSALMSGEGARFDPWEELLQKLRQATIGEYEIKGELGRGGMAAVLLAHDLQLNRKVAIKVMLPGLVYGASMWDRFLSEARTAAKLDHPNIIYIHSVKEKDRFLYFVMKYIDGRSLDDILVHHKPLPVPVAQTILVEVARALDYAHHEGVVHRDIKPANIMIDQKGNSIVMDFGIARATDEKRFTQTGATIGTPAYMSPEQCRGNETTAASDQYSLGILAYEMLAGAPPFGGTPIELQIAHMQDSPRGLRDLRPDISLELSGAIMRMLSKDPADRWPSLQQLVPIFGRGLDPLDDEPRQHLIALVKEGASRRKSFPATPVSLSASSLNAAATSGPAVAAAGTSAPSGESSGTQRAPSRTPPVADEILSSVTRPVSAKELSEHVARLSVESAAIVSGQHATSGGDVATPSRSAPTDPMGEPGESPTALAPESTEPPDELAATVETEADTRPRKSRMPVYAVATVVGAGVLWVALAKGGKKPDVPVAPVRDTTAVVAAPTETVFSDSVAMGHGPDATIAIKGKMPRIVTTDAVSLLLLSVAKPRVAVGDTIRARLEVQDDSGLPVTTSQILWTTSNPRVVHFVAPGSLLAVAEGKATITVTAGTVTTTHDITVGPRAAAAKPAKRAPVPDSAKRPTAKTPS